MAILHLAWQLRVARNDLWGASAEIGTLIIDVDSVTRALQRKKDAIANQPTPLVPAVENGIRHAIIPCYDALHVIVGKLDAFQTRVGAAA